MGKGVGLRARKGCRRGAELVFRLDAWEGDGRGFKGRLFFIERVIGGFRVG